MTTSTYQPRILISGGGTGGHVYPALAIADAIRARYAGAAIEFVGAEGRMEMEKVPKHGYKIHGLWISGLQRKSLLKNLSLPFKIISSRRRVKSIIKSFRPDAVVGVGGYASWALVQVAANKKIPSLIQEQNSYPGITNKMLAKKVNRICVAYPGMEKYFPKDKIVITGNPVRQFDALTEPEKIHAYEYFALNPSRKTVLVIGGSLGARSINEAVMHHANDIRTAEWQLLWQTGKYYFDNILQQFADSPKNIRIQPFIDRMEYAYGIADVVISRAGAISISELALLGKAAILVPSPNVAEDHQTKNAKILTDNEAAVLVKDADIKERIVDEITALLEDEGKRKTLERNVKTFAKPDAANAIVDELVKLLNEN
jgi:UDP-N-acetylglucosamine--N-acetylmuramyl-(pentapeptide) pyrophosphoryl-undecaprenol N-acetylglucosamine transferase